MEEAPKMENLITESMRKRVVDFKEQADSLTLEGVRRVLEKDLGLKALSLDGHKRFIKNCLQKCFDALDDENASKNSGDTSDHPVSADKGETTKPPEDLHLHKEVNGLTSEDECKDKRSPVLMRNETTESESEAPEGVKSDKIPDEETIKKAIKKRASYFRANSETINLLGVRRMLEEDLQLEKGVLDAYKSFIRDQLDAVLAHSEVIKSMNEVKRKGLKKASQGVHTGRTSKVAKKVNRGDASSDSSDSNVTHSEDEEVDEEPVRSKENNAQKGKASTTGGIKKRKRSLDEDKSPIKKKNSVESKTAESNGTGKSENSSIDRDSQSSAKESTKKKKEEVASHVYGKRVEHLKSIIKQCGMGIPPSVYKRAKQAPESKREAYLVKELEDILEREGLSTNPSEKEIKAVRKKKETEKELEGIDMSNIVSSSRRRTTSNFILPPKPSLPVESGSDDEEGEEGDTDNDDSDSGESSGGNSEENVEDESD